VVLAVPGQERHPAALDLADEHRLARLAERRLHPDLFGVGQELIEAGPADYPDVRDRLRGVLGVIPPKGGSHGGQATFSPDELPEDDDAEPAVEGDDEDEDESPDFAADEEEESAEEEPLSFDPSSFDEEADEVEPPDDPLPRLSVR